MTLTNRKRRLEDAAKGRAALALACVLVTAIGMIWQATTTKSDGRLAFESKEAIGEALFFDVNLSKNRTQACATCHAPDAAFTDPRENEGAGRAVSRGDDGTSLGDRNTPTVTYAALSPRFHFNSENKPVGGFFLDGRAHTLEEQAASPPLNPIEMAMSNSADLVGRIKENPDYVKSLKSLFGPDVFESDSKAMAAMSSSIAAYERTDLFQPFDSKYDRSLRGEVKLTDQEELGRVLFFSSQFSNCSKCHKQQLLGGAEKETFTNYQYHNIGTPVNKAARALNGAKSGHIDEGLRDNPAASDSRFSGKFKVPTLRNVAVTGPYMHNGVFNDLRTVVAFYNKYNSKNPRHQIDPETKAKWADPEVADSISIEELESSSALNAKRIDALVAFLRTLTDKRYEHLLPPLPTVQPHAAEQPASTAPTP